MAWIIFHIVHFFLHLIPCLLMHMVHERRQHLTCWNNLLANISHGPITCPHNYTIAPKWQEASMELLFNISSNVIILLIISASFIMYAQLCVLTNFTVVDNLLVHYVLTLRLKPSMTVSENMFLDKSHYLQWLYMNKRCSKNKILLLIFFRILQKA